MTKPDKKNKKKKEPFIDDGRVIADMSVDGMPTSIPERLFVGGRRNKIPKLDDQGYPLTQSDTVELTKDEKRSIRNGVIKAFLIYGGISIGLMVAVMLLLYFFWL